MTPVYEAQTAYGVAIPKHLASFKDALEWADLNADTFPGCKIVRRSEAGTRTVWRHVPEREAA